MKFTKKHENQLREYMGKMDAAGCLTADQWTSGKGRFTTIKALPPFVERFDRREYTDTTRPKHGTMERMAYEFFKANPKRRTVLILDKAAFAGFAFGSMHGNEF